MVTQHTKEHIKNHNTIYMTIETRVPFTVASIFFIFNILNRLLLMFVAIHSIINPLNDSLDKGSVHYYINFYNCIDFQLANNDVCRGLSDSRGFLLPFKKHWINLSLFNLMIQKLTDKPWGKVNTFTPQRCITQLSWTPLTATSINLNKPPKFGVNTVRLIIISSVNIIVLRQ